ncbi:MAG: LptF/LptG family permease [Ekhidna sp.]|uniref:LptF/LptG family permease n=1 Tax=Ekhidna sp. TaxID=2608089 RepID=UPI0032ECA2D0
MKKLDVLMLKSFIAPFVLTTAVANFILLLQYMLKYFDDFVGKNLGFTVFAELLFYFSLNMLQIALPLGVLLASLMTFGNLGEHFELTAIKSSGITILRALRPIFLFVIVLSIGAYFFNNYTIPAANLKAYSLLYDIKHTKPALDIKAGAFYNGIPDYSIKAKDKLPDGKTLIDVIIYDHAIGRGNKTVILADSSLMYTIMDDRYLKLELYNGHYYSEEAESESEIDRFYRTEYDKMDMVFSLASFDLKRRKEELFQNNRQMKNIDELRHDIDSFQNATLSQKANFIRGISQYLGYHFQKKKGIIDRIQLADSINGGSFNLIEASFLSFDFGQTYVKKESQKKFDGNKKDKRILPENNPSVMNFTDSLKSEGVLMKRALKAQKIDTFTWSYIESYVNIVWKSKKVLYTEALNKARNVKVAINSAKTRRDQLTREINLYTIEMQKKYAQALACILMFLIGAPLGAIIKKGGLGVPTIIAIFFFIIYYAFTSIGEKQAKTGVMDPYLASWMSDLVLLPFGLFFLRQARIDARLFDIDIYTIWIEKLKRRFARNHNKA